MNPLFVPVDVDGHTIEFAVDLSWCHPILGPDPMAGLLATGRFPPSAANELWRHLIHPGTRVVDVGAYLGTYSLPAAALGAHVLAVEASESNATLLKLAAERNGFGSVETVHAAASRRSATVDFKSAGPWGHVTFEIELAEGQPGTPTTGVALDELLQGRSWEHVDLIKIDVEGSEVEALAGLRTCLARQDAPPVIIEANGVALHGYGYAPRDVLDALEQHGYRCYLIDPPPGHRIVPVGSDDLQPEAVADYIAFKDLPSRLLPWSIAPPLTRHEVISRVLATCTHEDIYHREYGARLLASAPRWLVEDDSIQELKASLDLPRLMGSEHVRQTAERAESPDAGAHRASYGTCARAQVASRGQVDDASFKPGAVSTTPPSASQPGSKQSRGSVGKLSPVSARPSESNLKRTARRLARPVLSPIDGRLADINRRVEYARTVVERSLAAYASSSTEASSYIGVELRGLRDQLAALDDQIATLRDQQTALRDQQSTLHDLVARLGERSFEDYYQLRLAQAVDLPLEKLDSSLAQAINSAMDHRGFSAQAGLWFNPPVVVELTAGRAVAATVTERIVEVPFAMAALSRVDRGARILDIGSAESTFPLSAASLGYKVTAVDPRPLAYSHPNLESHASLLEEWDASPEPFAAAFVISTIEHVGLGAYGERAYGSPEHGAGADAAFLGRVRELLSPEGLMILTAPYGKRDVTELERIYDEESMNKLLSDWEVLERQIVARRDALTWEADEKVVTAARGAVMVIASPKQA